MEGKSGARAANKARRARRTRRFAQPLVGWRRRLRAWAHMLFVDHGVFRLVYLNLHPLGTRAWRSAQPSPGQIARLAAKGLRTVVNLRAEGDTGSYALEREACDRLGLAFEEIKLRSRMAPHRETIEAVAALLDRIDYPALFHCKSGADRAGLMAALYLLLREGADVATAKAQLALRFGHFRAARTGVLDAFLDAFADAEAAATARGEALDFLTWVRRDYDRHAVARAFRENSALSFLVDRVLSRE